MQNETPDFTNGIDTLATQGYVVYEDFLPMPTIQGLAAIALARQASGAMRSAGVGKNHRVFDVNIRGDSIHWLEEDDTNPPVQAYFQAMHALKTSINQTLLMGLSSLETHFAIYPPGSYYQKHLDQFTTSDTSQLAVRRLSSIVYLNTSWQAADGGALRLYTGESTYLDIAPTAGRLVLFLSGQFLHEVLPVQTQRISLAGWFKSR